MWQVAGPIVFVVFVWWFTTGAVILLGRLPAATHGWSLAGATLVLIASLLALKVASETVTTASVVVTFSAVIGIWAWHEMSFLFGYVTGHRNEACPDWASGWTRFRFAFAALSHHELALLATFLVVLALTWGAENLYGLGAFAILWLMRITAKLNLFLGVPHFSEEVLPRRLAYLASYFRKRQVAGFFMATLIVSSGVALALISRLATAVDLGAAHTVGMIMLVSLLALAILEHVFMAVPFADIALWRWALIEEGGGRRFARSDRKTRTNNPRRSIVRRLAAGMRTPVEACATTSTRRGGDFDNGL
jgi:putative photosynthetic complex assembly protein 2